MHECPTTSINITRIRYLCVNVYDHIYFNKKKIEMCCPKWKRKRFDYS